MSSHADSATITAALTDFSFERFATVRLVPILYILGLIAGGVFAAAQLLMAFRMGFVVGAVSLVMIPLVFLLFALYLRVVLEMVIVLFRIERGIARMAGPAEPPM